MSLANQRFGFSKVSGSQKSAFLAVAFFQIFVSRKLAQVFGSKSFVSNWLRFLKLASWFSVRLWQASSFILQSPFFVACVLFGQVRFLKSASRFLEKVLASLVRAFLPDSFFLAKQIFRKVSF